MPLESADALLNLLEQSELLPPEKVRAVRRSVERREGPPRPKDLARSLVKNDLLTRWQAEQLLRGRKHFRIGDYRLLEPLGEAVAADGHRVYLAEHAERGHRVVAEPLPKWATDHPEAKRAFIERAKAAAKVHRAGLARLLEIKNAAGRHYLIRQSSEGKSLRDRVEADGPLGLADAAEAVRQAAAALAYLHGRDVAHGAVRPGEMFVDDRGALQLGGLLSPLPASLAELGDKDPVALEVAECLAPELITGTDLTPDMLPTPASDVYALGCTFYFLLCGKVPFGEATVTERLAGHKRHRPPGILRSRPDVPDAMLKLCQRMLDKEPDERPKAADIARLLGSARKGMAEPPVLLVAPAKTGSDRRENDALATVDQSPPVPDKPEARAEKPAKEPDAESPAREEEVPAEEPAAERGERQKIAARPAPPRPAGKKRKSKEKDKSRRSDRSEAAEPAPTDEIPSFAPAAAAIADGGVGAAPRISTGGRGGTRRRTSRAATKQNGEPAAPGFFRRYGLWLGIGGGVVLLFLAGVTVTLAIMLGGSSKESTVAEAEPTADPSTAAASDDAPTSDESSGHAGTDAAGDDATTADDGNADDGNTDTDTHAGVGDSLDAALDGFTADVIPSSPSPSDQVATASADGDADVPQSDSASADGDASAEPADDDSPTAKGNGNDEGSDSDSAAVDGEASQDDKPKKKEPEKKPEKKEPKKQPPPFKDFPKFAALPALGGGEGDGSPNLDPVALGKLHADDSSIIYAITGADELLEDGKFELERVAGERTARLVKLVPEKGDPVAIARFWYADESDELMFQWLDGATKQNGAGVLRYCGLRLVVRGERQAFPLSKPQGVQPIVLDLDQPNQTISLKGQDVPNPELLRLKVTKLEGGLKELQQRPDGGVAPRKPMLVNIARKDHNNNFHDGVVMELRMMVVRDAISVIAKIKYPPLGNLRPLAGMTEEQRKQAQKQFDKIKKEMSGRGGDRRIPLEQQLAQINEMLWYHDLVKNHNKVLKLHYRVYLEADDAQTDLFDSTVATGPEL